MATLLGNAKQPSEKAAGSVSKPFFLGLWIHVRTPTCNQAFSFTDVSLKIRSVAKPKSKYVFFDETMDICPTLGYPFSEMHATQPLRQQKSCTAR